MRNLAAMVFGTVALLLLSASAKADTYLYDFNTPNPFGPGVVDIQFTETTLAPTGNVTSFTSVTDPSGTVNDFVWSSATGQFCIFIEIPGEGCAGYKQADGSAFVSPFAAGSFLSTGTYDGLPSGNTTTLTITDVTPAPEPSMVALLGAGLLGLIGIRLRKGYAYCDSSAA